MNIVKFVVAALVAAAVPVSAQNTVPGGTDGRNPGLYVQVLDGTIHVTNQGGTQNFTAGQFGFTPGFKQPPIILPTNPGMQFTPPPSFSSVGTSAASGILIKGVTGVVKVTEPDGTVVTIKAGDPVPAIPAGSAIAVVSGSVDIAGTGAKVQVDGVTVNAGSGVNFSVTVSGNSVAVGVTAGSVSVTDNGVTQTVAQGGSVTVAAPAGTNSAPESNASNTGTTTGPASNPAQENTVVSPSSP